MKKLYFIFYLSFLFFALPVSVFADVTGDGYGSFGGGGGGEIYIPQQPIQPTKPNNTKTGKNSSNKKKKVEEIKEEILGSFEEYKEIKFSVSCDKELLKELKITNTKEVSENEIPEEIDLLKCEKYTEESESILNTYEIDPEDELLLHYTISLKGGDYKILYKSGKNETVTFHYEDLLKTEKLMSITDKSEVLITVFWDVEPIDINIIRPDDTICSLEELKIQELDHKYLYSFSEPMLGDWKISYYQKSNKEITYDVNVQIIKEPEPSPEPVISENTMPSPIPSETPPIEEPSPIPSETVIYTPDQITIAFLAGYGIMTVVFGIGIFAVIKFTKR